ncbi:hypothetical protein FisN_4Lh194 [Fistulifera solaris]|uniref:PH domain-containing protein n=1 Tax=Fistulifera solaris TaxID=1519565 RepID=A0A1Z5JZM5_FISSO|nr:hypothetical protein FisN_4Lh194 [Fistulifera solaris]|eukprot:GAX19221.1 hypothetical protein FisN_4Lh194 [Fistulifera solaris]
MLQFDTDAPTVQDDPKVSFASNVSTAEDSSNPYSNNTVRSPGPIAPYNSTDYGEYVLSDEDYEKFWLTEEDEEDEAELRPSHSNLTDTAIQDKTTADEPTLRFRSYSHGDILSRQILATASDDDMAAYADDESEKQISSSSTTLRMTNKTSPSKKSSRLSSSLTSPNKKRNHTRSASLNAKPFLRYLRNFKVGREKRDAEGKETDEDMPNVHRVVDADSSSSSPSMPDDGCVDDEDEEEEAGQVNFIPAGASEYDSWDESSSLELDEDMAPTAVHDWGSLPPLPNKFIPNPDPRDTQMNTRNIPYLDADILEESEQMSKLDANIFVLEHALLLRSVMQLLIERDHIGVEGSVDDMDNIIKRGPLKKTTFAVGKRGHKKIRATWGIKYVELRRGNLTYYGDNAKNGERKTIHLRQKEAVVQENTALDRGTDGFPFELLVQGNPPRYWMARSEEERQSWIRAIEAAMIGDETRSTRSLDLTPYRISIDASSKLKSTLSHAATKDSYINAIKHVKKELGIDQPLQLPVQWLKQQMQLETSKEEDTNRNPLTRRNVPPDRVIKFSFQQFWKSMHQLNASINGFEIPPSSPAAPERVVGSLTRCILEFDKANQNHSNIHGASNEISELQAVSYARIILSSVLQSKKEGVTFDVLHHFLQPQSDVICISQELEDEAESATHFEVSFAGDDLPEDLFLETDYEKDQSSWIYLARRRNKKVTVPKSRWRRRYAVLSGAVLSFYEAATPRPHGLRGQFVLSGQCEVIALETSKDTDGSTLVSPRGDLRYAICICSPGEQDCLLCFEYKGDMESWQETLDLQVRALAAAKQDTSEEVIALSRQKNATGMLKGAERVIKGAADSGIRVGGRVIKGATDTMKSATDGSMKVVKRATDGSMKAMRRATDSSMKVIRGAVRTFRSTGNRDEAEVSHPRISRVIRKATSSHLLSTATDSGKREPSVQCIVQRSSTFSIRSALARTKHYYDDGDDDEDEDDHWLTVQVTWYQAFLMSGGSSGKINSGDALIELDFVDKEEDTDEEYVGELEVL